MNFILLTKSTTPIISWFSSAMGYVMEWIFDFLGVFGIANIGLTIIIFTIIIKLVMIPMSINQQKFTKISQNTP